MRSDAASIQVLDPERDELVLLASCGFAPASARFWERVAVAAESVCRAALDAGERVVIEDVQDPASGFIGSPDADEWRRSGLRAVQSTPLLSRRGECLGMISTHWTEPHAPSTDDLSRLDVLARQAADLIERARAEGRLKESEARLRLFGEAASDVIWTRGAENLHWEYLSPAFEAIYGIERASVLGGMTCGPGPS